MQGESSPRPHPGIRLPNAAPFIGRSLRNVWARFEVELQAGVQTIDPLATPTSSRVLILVDTGGTTIGELARRAGVTKQSMAEAVAALDDRGLVRREPDPNDGRAKRVVLTAAGWDAVRRGQAVAADIHARWTAALGERDMTRLLALLTKLDAALDDQ
jgi:DNA-binding MarR family transcriptional regulator